MSLIKVGIHENLALSAKSAINEHGTLELVIGSVQSQEALLEAFEGNDVFDNMESSLRFYPPSITDFNKKSKTSADIGAELLKMRYQFMQYALLYTTKETAQDAIGGTKMFEGLGIPKEDYPKVLGMLTNEELLKKICTNLANKFLDLLKKLDAFSGKVLFRQKFLRQSPEKNFAVIPNSTFDIWIEPMSIPKSASKIEYSLWEIENKKNDPNPGKVDSKQSTAKDKEKAANLFKKPEGPEHELPFDAGEDEKVEHGDEVTETTTDEVEKSQGTKKPDLFAKTETEK